jgi:DNA polymerase III subunit alpha
MEFCHLKTHSTFSLRKSIIQPQDLVERAVEQGVTSLAITERGNLFSSVKIFNECKAKKIKPIMGIDLYIAGETLSSLTLLAKNLSGWKDLLKIVAKSNGVENFNYDKEIPTIKIEDLAPLCSKNLIAYCGNLYSWLIPSLITNYEEFLKTKTYEEAKKFVKDDWKKILADSLAKLIEMFGRENIRLESQRVDTKEIPAAEVVVRIVEWAAKTHKIPCIATCSPHYIDKNQSENHKILICTDKKTTLRNIENLLNNEFDPEYFRFFRNNNAYLLNQEDYKALYTQEQLENNSNLAGLIESYDICGKPKLPDFVCPNNIPSIEFLKKICNEGLIKHKLEGKSEYQERLKFELGVMDSVGLAPYFLIIWDIVKFCNSNNWLAASRGSVGGSLIAYTLGISECDPIKYNLLFSRFYNDGRNSPGNIAMPDIDLDLPSLHRDECFDYLRVKYGREKTGNVVTFSGLKAAAALKEVFRVRGNVPVDVANQITKFIVREDKISDELEELRKAGEDDSAIKWSIDNVVGLKQFVEYNDKGELCGEFASDFNTAMQLEGCKRGIGKHACAMVVANENIEEFCPMVLDKSNGNLMVALEKNDAEAIGCLKMDLLSVSALDDTMECIRLINEGDLI